MKTVITLLCCSLLFRGYTQTHSKVSLVVSSGINYVLISNLIEDEENSAWTKSEKFRGNITHNFGLGTYFQIGKFQISTEVSSIRRGFQGLNYSVTQQLSPGQISSGQSASNSNNDIKVYFNFLEFQTGIGYSVAINKNFNMIPRIKLGIGQHLGYYSRYKLVDEEWSDNRYKYSGLGNSSDDNPTFSVGANLDFQCILSEADNLKLEFGPSFNQTLNPFSSWQNKFTLSSLQFRASFIYNFTKK